MTDAHPRCARCPHPILPGQPAAHRNGVPYIHLDCAGRHEVALDDRTRREDQHGIGGAFRRKGEGFAPPSGAVCRRVPPAKAAP